LDEQTEEWTMKTIDPLKPVGAWEVRRRIKIPALVHEADAIVAERTLGALRGILKVRADLGKHKIEVRYDITASDFRTIADALAEVGLPHPNNWWWRYKANQLQYLDTNGRDNANTPAPPCCSNPKGICHQQRRK
jgi:hypothetical protein